MEFKSRALGNGAASVVSAGILTGSELDLGHGKCLSKCFYSCNAVAMAGRLRAVDLPEAIGALARGTPCARWLRDYHPHGHM